MAKSGEWQLDKPQPEPMRPVDALHAYLLDFFGIPRLELSEVAGPPPDVDLTLAEHDEAEETRPFWNAGSNVAQPGDEPLT